MNISSIYRGLRNNWSCEEEKISGVVEGLKMDRFITWINGEVNLNATKIKGR